MPLVDYADEDSSSEGEAGEVNESKGNLNQMHACTLATPQTLPTFSSTLCPSSIQTLPKNSLKSNKRVMLIDQPEFFDSSADSSSSNEEDRVMHDKKKRGVKRQRSTKKFASLLDALPPPREAVNKIDDSVDDSLARKTLYDDSLSEDDFDFEECDNSEKKDMCEFQSIICVV